MKNHTSDVRGIISHNLRYLEAQNLKTHLTPDPEGGSFLVGATGPTAFKNMPTRNGRIIPGSPLMNPIRQSLAREKNACALPPLMQESPHPLFTLTVLPLDIN